MGVQSNGQSCRNTRKIGIVGLGKMGVLHSAIVNSQSDARVNAICEKDRLLAKLARSFLPKAVNFYEDHSEMVEKEDLDAVFITTPIDTHVPVVTDLAGARKDLSLFVEKPLAPTYEQAQVACEAAKRLRGVHMVGFQKRFSPVFQQARESIANGSLGDPMFFRAYSFSSDVLHAGQSWRMRKGAGGVLLDLAPHLLDLLLWFFGKASEITGSRRSVYSSEVDDYVHAVLSFESGLKGHADISWSVRNFRLPETSIDVYGKNGMLSVTDDCVKIRIDEQASRGIGPARIYYRQSFDTSVSFLLADPEYTLEDEAFLRATGTQEMPESNFVEASKVNAAIDRIFAASSQ